MLAAEYVVGAWDYGMSSLIASPKLNGVRGLGHERLMARSLKPIPNKYCQKLFGNESCYGLDGELVVGKFDDEDVFVLSTSGVMSHEGMPEVLWHVFDAWAIPLPFAERIEALQEHLECLGHPQIVRVPHKVINSDEELVVFADECLSLGYEGLVLRDPKAMYKHGRSTSLEGGFMRFCPWLRSEAIILEVLEGETNTNVAQTNELGRTFRSNHKAGMVKTGTAGALRVRDMKTGLESKIPTTTDALCKWFWGNKDKVIGEIVKYKFKPPVKKGGLPRFSQMDSSYMPSFRDPLDMSE